MLSEERPIERNVGGFAGWPTPNEWGSGIMHCCPVNAIERKLDWDGRYALLGRVAAAGVALTFPISERMVEVCIEKNRYALWIRGYEVVDIDPPGRLCPLYQREYYRQDRTLWKKVTRFVSQEQINW